MRCVLARSAPAALVLALLLPGCFAWPWDEVIAQRDGGAGDASATDAGERDAGARDAGSDGAASDAAQDGGARLPDRLLVFSRLSIDAPSGAGAVGFDLDGVVSEGLSEHCDDRADDVSPAGVPGIDNVFAQVIGTIEDFTGASVEGIFAQRIDAGVSLAIELSELDDALDDDAVRVRAFLAFHADPGAPRREGGRLAPGQTFALQPIGDPGSGRIEDGELIVELVELPLPLPLIDGGVRVFSLSDVRLRGVLREDSMTSAVLGGALSLAQFSGSTATLLEQVADLDFDGAICRALSVGASVEAIEARALGEGTLPLVWVAHSTPELGCVGARGYPPTGGPGSATVRVNERRGGTVRDGHTVQIFHGQPLPTCELCIEERVSDGMFTFDAVGGAWFSWRVLAGPTPMSASDPVATVGYFGRVAVGTARDNAIEYVSHATAEALAHEHGRSREASSTMVVGTVRDCAGAPLGGAEVRVFVAGERLVDGMVAGAETAAFVGYRDGLGEVSQRPFSSAGDYVVGNLPRAWGPVHLEAWATLEEGAAPVRVACEQLEPLGTDEAVLIDLGPTRIPEAYPFRSPCQ